MRQSDDAATSGSGRSALRASRPLRAAAGRRLAGRRQRADRVRPPRERQPLSDLHDDRDRHPAASADEESEVQQLRPVVRTRREADRLRALLQADRPLDDERGRYGTAAAGLDAGGVRAGAELVSRRKTGRVRRRGPARRAGTLGDRNRRPGQASTDHGRRRRPLLVAGRNGDRLRPAHLFTRGRPLRPDLHGLGIRRPAHGPDRRSDGRGGRTELVARRQQDPLLERPWRARGRRRPARSLDDECERQRPQARDGHAEPRRDRSRLGHPTAD